MFNVFVCNIQDVLFFTIDIDNFRFEFDKRELPVLWHQALLTFVQRYKGEISSEQRDFLLQLLHVHSHHTITAEIRRELASAKCRDLEKAKRESTSMQVD